MHFSCSILPASTCYRQSAILCVSTGILERCWKLKLPLFSEFYLTMAASFTHILDPAHLSMREPATFSSVKTPSNTLSYSLFSGSPWIARPISPSPPIVIHLPTLAIQGKLQNKPWRCYYSRENSLRCCNRCDIYDAQYRKSHFRFSIFKTQLPGSIPLCRFVWVPCNQRQANDQQTEIARRSRRNQSAVGRIRHAILRVYLWCRSHYDHAPTAVQVFEQSGKVLYSIPWVINLN